MYIYSKVRVKLNEARNILRTIFWVKMIGKVGTYFVEFFNVKNWLILTYVKRKRNFLYETMMIFLHKNSTMVKKMKEFGISTFSPPIPITLNPKKSSYKFFLRNKFEFGKFCNEIVRFICTEILYFRFWISLIY